jgi:hypothetical protein
LVPDAAKSPSIAEDSAGEHGGKHAETNARQEWPGGRDPADAEELGIGFVPFSPLGAGLPTGKIDETTAFTAVSHMREALFAVVAATLPHFIGIHNAWDSVVYHVLSSAERRRQEKTSEEDKL